MVVKSISIDMNDITLRPFTESDEPNELMRVVSVFLELNLYILLLPNPGDSPRQITGFYSTTSCNLPN